MTTSRLTNMRSALRAAAAGALEQGWLYLESSQSPSLDAPCLMVDADPDDDTEAIAREKGFSQEGLDTATIEDTAKWAGQFQNPPADELFLESFVYYWRFDAWLPAPGAPEPPPWEEAKKRMDREFFEMLGPERDGVPCRSEGCKRGAVSQSIFCRVHHYEMIKKELCPFSD